MDVKKIASQVQNFVQKKAQVITPKIQEAGKKIQPTFEKAKDKTVVGKDKLQETLAILAQNAKAGIEKAKDKIKK